MRKESKQLFQRPQEDATISQCHALLLTCLGGVILVDLDSTNGTFVNGMPAPSDEQVRLTEADVIVIGGVVLRYETSPARHR